MIFAEEGTAATLAEKLRPCTVDALRCLWPMHGGSQSKLMRASDGHLYVVKFPNNPQGRRILINEVLGSALAALVGFRVPEFAIVNLSGKLVSSDPQLFIRNNQSEPCEAGPCFGSRFYYAPFDPTLHVSSRARLPALVDIQHFVGKIAFDLWVDNRDYTQAIFAEGEVPWRSVPLFIDFGHCFGWTAWWLLTEQLTRNPHCWEWQRELVRDERSLFEWSDRIASIDWKIITTIVSALPISWLADDVSLQNLLRILRKRAAHIHSFIQQLVRERYFPLFDHRSVARNRIHRKTQSRQNLS